MSFEKSFQFFRLALRIGNPHDRSIDQSASSNRVPAGRTGRRQRGSGAQSPRHSPTPYANVRGLPFKGSVATNGKFSDALEPPLSREMQNLRLLPQ